MFHRQLSLSLCDIHEMITLRQLSPHDILLNTTDVYKGLGLHTTSTIINHRSQGTTFAVKSQGMSFSVLVRMPSSSRSKCRISQLGPALFDRENDDQFKTAGFMTLLRTYIDWLVVWNIFLFFHILGIIIPTDFHIFQRGRYATNQDIYGIFLTFLNPYFTGRRSQKKHDIILGA